MREFNYTTISSLFLSSSLSSIFSDHLIWFILSSQSNFYFSSQILLFLISKFCSHTLLLRVNWTNQMLTPACQPKVCLSYLEKRISNSSAIYHGQVFSHCKRLIIHIETKTRSPFKPPKAKNPNHWVPSYKWLFYLVYDHSKFNKRTFFMHAYEDSIENK